MEFLIALIATFQFWSQVGGQSHIDLMPWWLKAVISLSISAAVVRVTMSTDRRQTLKWSSVLALLLLSAGFMTYYFHLYEPQDETGDEDQVTPTSLVVNATERGWVLKAA